MGESDLLGKILKSKLCTGCGICEAVVGKHKIKIELNEEGFYRPKTTVSLDAAQEQILRAICPGLGLEHKSSHEQYYPLWGPLIDCQVGYAANENIRQLGSSGGAITALLIYLLESKKINAAVHVSVSSDDPIKNKVTISKSREDILGCAGSRYAPSAPLIDLDKILTSDETFAIVGKPCDIGALRKYGEINPLISEKIPYMISFVCAGVPSVKGTLAILDKFCVSHQEVESFQYRGNGWPGKTKIQTTDGRQFELSYSQAWGSILNKYIQFRCKVCPDGTGEFADIVCGDAWFGGEKGYPDFSERDGRSLILTRTQVGKELLQESINASVLRCQPLDVLEIQNMQPYQAARKKVILARLFAMRLLNFLVPRFKGFRLVHLGMKAGVSNSLKNFVGMGYRCLSLRNKR